MPASPLTFKPLGAMKGSLKKGTDRDGKLLRKGKKLTKEEQRQAARKAQQVKQTGSLTDQSSAAHVLEQKYPGLKVGKLLRGGAA